MMAEAVQTSNRNFWLSINGALLAVAVLTGAAAWWLIAWPVAALSNIARHPDHFAQIFTHMIGGTAMLFLGGANLYLGATRRNQTLHRMIGRTYLVLGSLGAFLAISIAVSPAHKPAGTPVLTNTSVSLTMLAVGWLVAAGMGWRAIRHRRIPAHRDWMIRSYVLAWSFVFCRLASRVPEIGGLGAGEAFIWLSWVAPFMICEIALQWRAGGPQVRA